MCGHKMPVSGEESETDMASENGEPTVPEEGAQDFAFKNKYKELKGRLKYLVYEQECYELELRSAEQTLLELSKDKNFLLDQLLRYEPVRDEEEELTDDSSSEEETPMNASFDAVPIVQQPSPLATTQVAAAVKSTGAPTSQSSATVVPKPSENTKRGIAKAKAILNSVAGRAVSTAKASGIKRQAKGGRISTGAVEKITKAVARARYSKNSHSTKLIVSSIPVSQPLVVSFPRHLASAAKTTQSTSTSVAQVSSTATAAVVQNHHVTTLGSGTNVGSVGGVLVSTVSSSQNIPVMSTGSITGAEGTTREGERQRRSSSSSTSSSSSSSSDSEDSGSESGSSSPEGMEVGGSLPVIMSSEAKKSSDLPKPKAITSPIKTVPPDMFSQASSSSIPPPPQLSPLTSPRLGSGIATNDSPGFTWSKPSGSMTSGNSSSMGFTPIAPPLTSPPSSLPFSLLSKQPGSVNSAFQIVNTKPPPSTTSPNNSAPHSHFDSSQTIVRTTET